MSKLITTKDIINTLSKAFDNEENILKCIEKQTEKGNFDILDVRIVIFKLKNNKKYPNLLNKLLKIPELTNKELKFVNTLKGLKAYA